MNGKPITVPESPVFKPSKVFCVPEEIMIVAFYYGIQAYTTSSEIICSEIRAHASTLSQKTRNLFVKVIKEELGRGEADPNSPWTKDWVRTLNILEGGKPEGTE